MQNFAHLHVHSEYSLLDGACRIKDIASAAKKAGHSAVAITDHGVLYGAVDFYKACTSLGVKPIIGCEVYLAPESRFLKSKTPDYFNTHLVLLVKNEAGYKNLTKLVSSAFTEGFYMKPRIDIELLEAHSEGLICLSGCIAGRIAQAILKDDISEAENFALRLKKIFGEDLYLEIQDHGLGEESKVNQALIPMSQRLNIPLVATNDVHYINKKDADTQAVLLCIQTNNVITDGRPIGFSTDEFYFKSTEEMASLFSYLPEALDNSAKIADKCSFDFEFGKTKLPRFIPPDGLSPKKYLEKLAFEGLERKVKSGQIVFDEEHSYDVYKSRIIYEHLIISKMGYDEYYLIVWDFIHYARTQGIPVGPGRGSGAGSLIAYLIGITDIDSVRHGLLFERFLNTERVSMPDFDIDFSDVRRDEVIKYIIGRYGEDHAAQIITFGTLAARAAVRDVGRAMGMPYNEVDKIANQIPQKSGTTIRDALDLNAELKSAYDSDYKVRELIDTAMALEGMPRHASKHAAGVVITDRQLTDYLPLASVSDAVVTQFDMDTVADLGLLKIDCLGLRFLTIIADAEAEIRKKEPSFDLSEIPLDDEESFKKLAMGHTDGVFQLESAGMTRLISEMKPRSIDDIMLAIALYRPGPMEMGAISKYLTNRDNKASIKYTIPVLAEVLDSTCGCIIYQEQVMQICRKVAGFSYGRADVVIHAMKKKKTEEIETQRQAFIKGAKANLYSEMDADALYDDLAGFAKYAFNKSHAAAYSVISYRTLYLKTHYPCEYYAALLTSVIGNAAKTSEYISYASKQGISILPPDINQSSLRYSVHGDKIRYPLSAIKSIGDGVVDTIVKERARKPYSGFIDFLERAVAFGINRQQLTALVSVGAFDSFGVYRSKLLNCIDKLYDSVVQNHKNSLDGQMDLFSQGNQQTLSLSDSYVYPDIEDLTARQKLSLEKEYMGLYLSGSLLDDYDKSIARHKCVRINDFLSAFNDKNENFGKYKDKSVVCICGIVSKVTRKNTKNGDVMAFVSIEDNGGDVEIVVFPKTYESYSYLLVKDKPLYVFGEASVKDDDEVKILARSLGELNENSEEQETVSNDGENPKSVTYQNSETVYGASVPEKLYIRIRNMKCREFERVMSVIDIFSEQGRTDVVFYDSEQGKYVKINSKITLTPSVIGILVEICGKDNVVVK